MSVIHIYGAEAALDVAVLLEQVRAGGKVVTDNSQQPPTVVSLVCKAQGRTLAEPYTVTSVPAQQRQPRNHSVSD